MVAAGEKLGEDAAAEVAMTGVAMTLHKYIAELRGREPFAARSEDACTFTETDDPAV